MPARRPSAHTSRASARRERPGEDGQPDEEQGLVRGQQAVGSVEHRSQGAVPRRGGPPAPLPTGRAHRRCGRRTAGCRTSGPGRRRARWRGGARRDGGTGARCPRAAASVSGSASPLARARKSRTAGLSASGTGGQGQWRQPVHVLAVDGEPFAAGGKDPQPRSVGRAAPRPAARPRPARSRRCRGTAPRTTARREAPRAAWGSCPRGMSTPVASATRSARRPFSTVDRSTQTTGRSSRAARVRARGRDGSCRRRPGRPGTPAAGRPDSARTIARSSSRPMMAPGRPGRTTLTGGGAAPR